MAINGEKSNNRSIEDLRAELESHGLELADDGHVKWDRRNPAHPRNWTAGRKAYNTSVILLLELITTMNGTAGTSVANQAQNIYDIRQSLSVFAFTSTYILGQGVGGIFFPPFSEAFGRRSLYIISSLLYCVFCVIAAAVPSLPVVIIARFATGILSAIPTIVVAGSIEDIFNIQARVWMIFCWVVIGNLGLVLGPIFSTYVTAALDWQWVFYIAAIATGIIFILCFGLKESRPSLLLERRVAALRETSNIHSYQSQNPDHIPNFKGLLNVTVARPVKLLFTEPIIIMASKYLIDYLEAVLTLSPGFSETQASLSLVPVGIGCLLGFLPRFYDHWLLTERRKLGRILEPEDKLLGFAIGVPVLALALWWFAWTIPPNVHTHWVVSMLALIPAGFAENDITFTLSGYLADSYTIYSASAFAGNLLARSLLIATILPFTQSIYTNISANAATSILAAIGTFFCVLPFVLLGRGKAIRKASPFAQYSLGAYTKNQVEDDMNAAGLVLET